MSYFDDYNNWHDNYRNETRCIQCGKGNYGKGHYCSHACYLNAQYPRYERYRQKALQNLSPIEQRLSNLLTEWRYEHETQKIIAPFRVDEWLPRERIIIEADGKMSHEAGLKYRDYQRDEQLIYNDDPRFNEEPLQIIRITGQALYTTPATLHTFLDWQAKQIREGNLDVVPFGRVLIGRTPIMGETGGSDALLGTVSVKLTNDDMLEISRYKS